MISGEESQRDTEAVAWVTPQYTRAEVNSAGQVLIRRRHTDADWKNYFSALDVINNWRSSHSLPLLHLRIFLERNARSIDQSALIAQRIKRLYSIELKLRRFPSMRMVQMQDIGGCRAIVGSVSEVRNLSEKMKISRTRNTLDHVDDYISKPQSSGYRGIHHVYRFDTDAVPACNGLKIEVQLRSTLQHAWATAVETVGTFTRQALKSGQGSDEWLRFFQLMGTVAASRENTLPVSNTPMDKTELMSELREHADRLAVINRLTAFGNALNISETAMEDARYFLLELDTNAENISVSGFKAQEILAAQRRYAEIEKRIAEDGGDAVLVSVNSLYALRRAYPNYFLDTRVFIEMLQHFLSG